jgi:phage terminase large subunit
MQTKEIITEVNLTLRPRKQFRPYLERDKRFSVLVCHRRAGKTVACLQDLLNRASKNPRQSPPPRYAYLAPTFDQVKQISWNYLKRYAAKIPDAKVHEADLMVTLPNGATIKLLSAENFERVRGTYIDGLVIDEAADCPPTAWHSVLRPCLADYQGWASLVGTPKGRGWLWQMWNQALDDPDWFTMILKADESKLIPEEELEAIKRGTPEHIYRQEFLCDFSVGRVGAIYARQLEEARNAKRISNDVMWHKECPVYTSWDIGAPQNQRVWVFQIIGDRFVFLESLFGDHDCGTPAEWAARLKSKSYGYGCHFIPHDAATQNGGLWQQYLQTAGLSNIIPVPRQYSVWDGISSALDSMPRVWFNSEGCKMGIDSLDQYHAKAETDGVTIRDVPVHDHSSHASDAFSLAFQAYRAGLIVDRSAIPRRPMMMGRPQVILASGMR